MEHPWPNIIAHADMDAFYAAVEQHDNPALRGKPLLIGPNSGRGVVLTASYEARPFGVGSAMPMAHARRLCPQALIVAPRFERYLEVSAQIMRVFDNFSPLVEPLSLDEAFLDMTGSEGLFGTPSSMGKRIKAAVRDATGLTVTVGIAGTKHVAKVASAQHKPDGLTVVSPAHTRAWLAPLPVACLWGVGPKMQARLQGLGFDHVGDLAASDVHHLTNLLGRHGAHLHALACGLDPRHVENRRRERSLGAERTLEHDVRDMAAIELHLRRAADRVAARLRAKGYVAGGVRVKLKTSGFQSLSRQKAIHPPTDLADILFRQACTLARRFTHAGPFRLVGLATYAIRERDQAGQLGLFDATPRQRRLETTIDALHSKFGPDAIRRASALGAQGTVLDDSPTLDFRAGPPLQSDDGMQDRDDDEDVADFDID